MLPHEKALVERLKDKPFALLGINSDGEAEDVKKMLAEQGITWRQAIDGDTTGPWATKWNVSGWPTLYLLDAKGKIREYWLGSPDEKELDQKIEALIAEAQAKH
ncbi:MAG: TlpA disulfide reductase family protein [Planctomycetota bacterium]